MSPLVVCVLLFLAAVSGRHEKYEGHQVFRIGVPASEIVYLDNKIDILSASPTSTENLDFLQAVVRLSPEEQQLWLDYFEHNGIVYSKIIDNIADVLRQEDSIVSESRTKAQLRDIIPNDDDSNENDNGNSESNENKSADDSNESNDNTSSSENGSESTSKENNSKESSESQENSESKQSGESQENSESKQSSENQENSESNESNENGDGDEESNENVNESESDEGTDTSDENGDEETEEDDDSWSIKWTTYYNHDEINAFIDEIGAKYPNLVTVINAALTFEGRQIKYVRISTSRFEDVRKPILVVNAGINARDWMTTPVAMYIINQLVIDIVDSQLVDLLDWIIVPISNPDGYEWALNEDRLWRKTRSLGHPGSFLCPGVDANRNFDHYWGTALNVADPCSDEYEGVSAFSEVESRVIRDALQPQLSRAALYISLQHERTNMILYPWAQNGTLPSNGLSLHLAGVRMATEIGGDYTVGNAGQVLGNPTGTGIDWTKRQDIPHTYIVELPASDGVEIAFLAPPELIPEVTAKTWAGINDIALYMISLYY